jgi:hypothetical protein
LENGAFCFEIGFGYIRHRRYTRIRRVTCRCTRCSVSSFPPSDTIFAVSSQTGSMRSAIVPGTGWSNYASGSDMLSFLTVTTLCRVPIFMRLL